MSSASRAILIGVGVVAFGILIVAIIIAIASKKPVPVHPDAEGSSRKIEDMSFQKERSSIEVQDLASANKASSFRMDSRSPKKARY